MGPEIRRRRLLDGRTLKFKFSFRTQTSCRLETCMDDCVAAVMAAVAAYRRRKQRIKSINQLALVLEGCPTRKMQSCPESISGAFATCVVQ